MEKTEWWEDAWSKSSRSAVVSIRASSRRPETLRTGVELSGRGADNHARTRRLLASYELDGAVQERLYVVVLALVDAGEPVGDADLELSRLDRTENGLDHRVDGEHLHAGRGERVVAGEVEELGVDHAGIHDVDANVGVAEVDLHALGPGGDGGLRRRVRTFGGRGEAGRDRRHEHDPSGPLGDLRQQGEREAHRREVVDLHDVFDDLGGQRL